ncbi:hypothetical protein [Hoylesella nanceiensis]|nr:hypothetical protein [Hoylesella nanceiensis]MBF1421609.1 hypothetical protein [Hoylesella nanceiensis]
MIHFRAISPLMKKNFYLYISKTKNTMELKRVGNNGPCHAVHCSLKRIK